MIRKSTKDPLMTQHLGLSQSRNQKDRPKTLTRQSKPLAGVRVLIVEDEMMQAWQIGDVVAELGGIPKVVFRFEQAIEAMAEEEFDCAILDVNLSGTLSFPIAKELQDQGVPVMFCTAYAEATRLYDGDMPIPRLDKPVGKRDLRDALLGLLSGPSGFN